MDRHARKWTVYVPRTHEREFERIHSCSRASSSTVAMRSAIDGASTSSAAPGAGAGQSTSSFCAKGSEARVRWRRRAIIPVFLGFSRASSRDIGAPGIASPRSTTSSTASRSRSDGSKEAAGWLAGGGGSGVVAMPSPLPRGLFAARASGCSGRLLPTDPEVEADDEGGEGVGASEGMGMGEAESAGVVADAPPVAFRSFRCRVSFPSVRLFLSH